MYGTFHDIFMNISEGKQKMIQCVAMYCKVFGEQSLHN